ncbi:hypothetical protein [Streptomyces sp. NBC_01483]|uniref:hypothetical protein n=1 Tax=Streptomyces sp. NBC_01483 TaxID=2903883 RepID=UPI002E3225E5|nr:hypothetical protein [Streptomyces sp. NBC_01483]
MPPIGASMLPHAAARQVQADGVDPVLIGGVEQQVADQRPRFGLAECAGVPGALEVDQQSVDGEVGVRDAPGVWTRVVIAVADLQDRPSPDAAPPRLRSRHE